jgi:DNA-binding IclR family transcriptional regulator
VKARTSSPRLRETGPALVQALSRGLGILSQFTAHDQTLSLTELSRRTGLHRATVYRFVKTLQAEGFLTLDVSTGLYRVGPAWAAALYSLGSNTVLAEILNHDLEQLAETTGETAALSVRRGDQVQIINAVPASRGFAPKLPESSLVALSESWNVHARIHLAYSSADTRQRITAVPAVRYTDHTVTEKATIRARVAKAAVDGITYSREEYKKGLCAAAVPVFSKGEVIASLGLIFPVERFDDEDLERYARELRAAAAAMGGRLDEALKQHVV